MTEHWPAVAYDRWGATCDTLHAHTQVLGKLAVELAPLDEDYEHARYDPGQVEEYFAAATQAALALAAFRAPYRSRSTPVNAWWGSFDLAVSLLVGQPGAQQELSVGWWPGNPAHPAPALYAYASPAPDGFAGGSLSPAAGGWDTNLGEYVLRWEEVVAASDPAASALDFARAALARAHACFGWPQELAQGADSA